MSFALGSIPNIMDKEKELKIIYNSSNEFILTRSYNSIELDISHFEQIIEAYQAKDIPSDPFEPFWRGILEARGMKLYSSHLFAYFIRDYLPSTQKKGLVIESRTASYEGHPNSSVSQLSFTIEEFKEAYNICKDYDNKLWDMGKVYSSLTFI